MEFNEDQIKEIGLSEDQVSKVQEMTNTHEAELKQGWDGKANEQAENILQGAFDLAVNKMGIEGVERQQGEKYADALQRTVPLFIDSALAKEKQAISTKERELEEKIKTGGDAALKAKLQETEGLLDGYKQKAAKFDEWEKEGYKDKYEQTSEKLSGMKLQVAFSAVKPNFPSSVNEYEAKAKWKEFKDNVISTHNIEINEEGEAIAIDKANEYKKTKLSELVKQNETISKLSAGREAKGLGGGKTNIKVDGVPFEVPQDATSVERQKVIKEYLTGELGLSPTSSEYSTKYAEFNKAILEKTPKK
jgi:hypothetical protein